MRRQRTATHMERLWQAMLAIAPVVAANIGQAPRGAAQLAREHAEALVEEWERTGRRGQP